MKIKLIDVCTPKQWKTIPTSDLLDEGYPVYGANGIIGYYSEFNHEDSVIAVTCRGATCGAINITMPKSYVTGNAMCLDNVRSDIEIEYLYYCLRYYDFNNVISGSAQPQITRQGMEKIVISVCRHDKQVEIINKLRCVEKIIQMRNKQLEYMDELVKARFVEMFGDPIVNSKKFDTKDLKDVLLLKAGDFTAASEIFGEPNKTNQYPCYGGNGIRGYVSEYNQEGEYSLIGRQGALSGNVQFASGKFKNTEHALLVKPILEMNNIWLNQLLINLDLKRYQTGAAQPGLSVKNLQEIPIIMVCIELQNQFADFVQQVDKSKVVDSIYLLRIGLYVLNIDEWNKYFGKYHAEKLA